MANQFFANDPTRLYGPIGQALFAEVPYLHCLKSGTFPAQVSAQLFAVAQGRPYMGYSLANPSFTPMINVCGSCSLLVDQNGTNQFQYSAYIGQGMGDKICLNTGFSAYMESLTSQLDAHQKGVVQLVNADTRWQLFLNCGIKAIVETGTSPQNTIYGGEYSYATPVPGVQSNASLTFSTLQSYNRYMRSVIFAKPFGMGQAAHARFLGSPDILDSLRNDLGGAAGPGGANIVPLGQVAAGGNKMAIEALTGFMFEPLYRGMQFAEDQRPLRLNWNGHGYDAVNPDIPYTASNGTVATTNPAWLQASHEVAFLFYDESFERQVPAAWTGEGKVRFARQLYGGEIQFMNHPDMAANLFQDFGVMAYRIGRAFRPIHPWFLMAIIYKRCQEQTNETTCSGVSGL